MILIGSWMIMRMNRRGVTLAEALAVLVIMGFVISGILYLLNQTHSIVFLQTSKNTAMRESRVIVNHIVNESRKEKTTSVTANLSASPKEVLIIQYASGNQSTYTFEPANKRLSCIQKVNGNTTTIVLSEKVNAISMDLSASEQIGIDLKMQAGNNKTHDISTVVALPTL